MNDLWERSMDISNKEMKRLLKACKKLGNEDVDRSSSYVRNLQSIALDFQMDGDVVKKSMRHSAKAKIGTYARLKSLINKYPDTVMGNRQLAKKLWGYNHWTRAKFLRKLVREFSKRNVCNQKALRKWAEERDFNKDVKGQFTAGRHGIGRVLFNWLKIRVGVDTIKADTHVQKFVFNAIGRTPPVQDIESSLKTVAKKLDRPAAEINSAIWNFQRNQ